MKLKHLIPLPVAVFLISLLVSASIVQAQTQILTETKESALIRASSQDPYFAKDALRTTEVLHVLKTLNALDVVNVTQGLNLLFSRQSIAIGNQILWGWPSTVYNQSYVSELYRPAVTIATLKLFNVIDQLNRTALIDMVMSRYNASEGAFHEPTTMVDKWHGKKEEYASCDFFLEFPGGGMDMAYANSNVISTFLATSILADLNALDRVNTTRIVGWILGCRAENGAFRPFPAASPDYLPGWSSLRTNYFYVDRYGTGIAYTYAGVGALRALGVRVGDVVDVEKVRQYVLACQKSYAGGTAVSLAHPDDNLGGYDYYTYYAIWILYFIGMVGNETEVLSKAVSYLMKWLQSPTLGFDSTWPIPSRSDNGYGGFSGEDYWAVAVLNLTGNLRLLDEPTPIVSRAWYNLLELSALASVSTFGLSAASLLAYNRFQTWKQKKRNTKLPPTVAT